MHGRKQTASVATDTRKQTLILEGTPHYNIARCPNCDKGGTFVYLGTQQFSERVAKAVGMTPTVYLWMCEHCHTTVVTPDVEI